MRVTSKPPTVSPRAQPKPTIHFANRAITNPPAIDRIRSLNAAAAANRQGEGEAFEDCDKRLVLARRASRSCSADRDCRAALARGRGLIAQVFSPAEELTQFSKASVAGAGAALAGGFRAGRESLLIEQVRFATDSSLEEDGFEPLVPPPKCARFFAAKGRVRLPNGPAGPSGS